MISISYKLADLYVHDSYGLCIHVNISSSLKNDRFETCIMIL